MVALDAFMEAAIVTTKPTPTPTSPSSSSAAAENGQGVAEHRNDYNYN